MGAGAVRLQGCQHQGETIPLRIGSLQGARRGRCLVSEVAGPGPHSLQGALSKGASDLSAVGLLRFRVFTVLCISCTHVMVHARLGAEQQH